jgi:hypothetical protein
MDLLSDIFAPLDHYLDIIIRIVWSEKNISDRVPPVRVEELFELHPLI